MKRVFLFGFVISSLAALGNAGTAGPGKISHLIYMSNGTVIFTLSGARVNPPSCAPTYYQTQWAIEANTNAGKARLSGLLAAYATRTSISITGTSTCSYWGDRESIDYFETFE